MSLADYGALLEIPFFETFQAATLYSQCQKLFEDRRTHSEQICSCSINLLCVSQDLLWLQVCYFSFETETG